LRVRYENILALKGRRPVIHRNPTQRMPGMRSSHVKSLQQKEAGNNSLMCDYNRTRSR
jgi:hypothetical protein